MRSSKQEDERTSTGRRTAIARSIATSCSSWFLSLAPREAIYLFYDSQTDDVRLVLTILGEAARFGAVNGEAARGERRPPARRPRGRSRRGRGRVWRALRGRGGGSVVERNRRLGRTECGPTSATDEEDVPRIWPSRGTHLLLDRADLSTGSAACIVPAARGATSSPPLVRRDPRRHHRQRRRRRRSPTAGSICSPRSTPSSARRWGRATWSALTRGAAVALDWRPEEVGRHLAQSGIVYGENRAACTVLLREVAAELSDASKGPDPIALLVDPSPEELAEWKREAPKAEIVSAGKADHARDAIAQARARAEGGEDVIVLIDSLTRFAESFGRRRRGTRALRRRPRHQPRHAHRGRRARAFLEAAVSGGKRCGARTALWRARSAPNPRSGCT